MSRQSGRRRTEQSESSCLRCVSLRASVVVLPPTAYPRICCQQWPSFAASVVEALYPSSFCLHTTSAGGCMKCKGTKSKVVGSARGKLINSCHCCDRLQVRGVVDGGRVSGGNTLMAQECAIVASVCCRPVVAEGTSFSLYVRFRTSRRRSAHLDEQKKSGAMQPIGGAIGESVTPD